MRFVTEHDGTIDVNWMWLPTWIGQNPVLMKELEDSCKSMLVGQFGTATIDDAMLDALQGHVIDFFQSKFSSIHGLGSYLGAIENVA